MRSMDIVNTSRTRKEIAAKLEASSRSLEGFLGGRRFYPEIRTVKFDYPNYRYTPTWWIDLGINRIAEVTSLVCGGTSISASDYVLRRSDSIDEPPYDRIELLLSTSASQSSGSTFQQSTVLTGIFNESDTRTDSVGSTLGSSINSSATTVVLNPSSGDYTPETGSILKIGDEWIVTYARSMSDTGQNIGNDLTAMNNNVSITVTDGTVFAVDEVLLVNSERMIVTDIAGNTLIVERAYDGSVLAAHTTGADIYAARTFKVRRGQLGSTAASHTLGDAVYTHEFPGLINELGIAETVVLLEQKSAGYARTTGGGASQKEVSNAGLLDIRENALRKYFPPVRCGAI